MKKKILIVEDDSSTREMIAYLLRKREYEVLEAGDGDDGWEKATTRAPDLIILDAMLPGRTGFEICTDLKEDARYRTIPILILTAITQGTSKGDEFWRKKSRADDFMSKRFKFKDLLERVERLLAGSPRKEE